MFRYLFSKNAVVCWYWVCVRVQDSKSEIGSIKASKFSLSKSMCNTSPVYIFHKLNITSKWYGSTHSPRCDDISSFQSSIIFFSFVLRVFFFLSVYNNKQTQLLLISFVKIYDSIEIEFDQETKSLKMLSY